MTALPPGDPALPPPLAVTATAVTAPPGAAADVSAPGTCTVTAG